MSINTTDTTFSYSVCETKGLLDSTFKALSYALTAGALGTAALTSTLSSSYLCHDFSDIPTYSRGYIENEEKGLQIPASTLFDFLKSYNFQQDNLDTIISYLFAYPDAQRFLAVMSGLIEKTYPGLSDKKNLQLISDPDTDELLLKLVFDSGLPIDEEFLERERTLFQEIKDAEIENGLVNVVFVNA